jgi:predicted cupin superfamily sugar epimerase
MNNRWCTSRSGSTFAVSRCAYLETAKAPGNHDVGGRASIVNRMDDDQQRVAALIDHYGLVELPVERTLYRSTWVSQQTGPDGGPLGTAIIGLYRTSPRSQSLFHRLQADEVWHFYDGDPIRLVLLHPDGATEVVVLGTDWAAGQRVQTVIPAGTWQAGELVAGGTWALFGCTMAPGFTGSTFEGGRRSELLEQFPEAADDIARLGVPDDESDALPDGFTQ